MSQLKVTRIGLFALLLAAASVAVVAAIYGLNRTPTANANGYTVPIAQGVSGPYEYLVGIWPPNPSVGNLHLAISLIANQRPVTDADVTVTGRFGDETPVEGPLPATAFFEPWTYELNMDLTNPGEWTFEIEINSPLGKTVYEAPLEVAGDVESAGPVAGERGVINGAQPGQAPTQQPAIGQATPRPGEGTELLELMSTRAAATPPAEVAQTPNENAGGSQSVAAGTPEDGGTNWAIIAVPLAILAVGVTAWALRRRQRPGPRPAGPDKTPPSRRRRKR